MSAVLLRAKRILTMDPTNPEIRDGGLLVRSGRIEALGPWAQLRGHGPTRDLGGATVVPGLINAHTHLGLCHLVGRIPGGLGFTAWADRLFTLLGGPIDPSALNATLQGALRTGTGFVADVVGAGGGGIGQALDTVGMDGYFFREVAGRFRGRDLGLDVLSGPWSAAVHALYSTSAGQARSVKDWCRRHGRPFSLHLAEAPGENELMLDGQGKFADFVRDRRILPRDFRVPGMSSVAYADALGLLDRRTLAVHCVQAGPEDIEALAASGATVCLCPRSNGHVGVGLPPVAALAGAGVPLCLGTDSLASNTDLDLWAELRLAGCLMPAGARLVDLLSMVTVNPARVLGIDKDFGSFAVGKRAVWAVLPPDLA